MTVASNLPSGASKAGDSQSKNVTSETRERVNYEVSETTRELVRQPGKINRLSIAVLVNGINESGAGGQKTWTARPDAELLALGELVKSAVGFDASRGDTMTIKSMEFTPLPENGTLATASVFSGVLENSFLLVQTGVLALVILGLGLFVIRPILLSGPLAALPAPFPDALDGDFSPLGDDLQLGFPAMGDTAQVDFSDDPVAQLRQIISERQDDTVEVLRNWIESSEEPV